VSEGKKKEKEKKKALQFTAASHTFPKADIIMQDLRFSQQSFRGLSSLLESYAVLMGQWFPNILKDSVTYQKCKSF